MIYLIGGVARAGKSTTTSALLSTGGIPYLGIDYVKMAFAKSMPTLGIDPEGDDSLTARQLWPFVKAMIETMIENGQDYAFEGVYLLPDDVDSLFRTHTDSVRACFLGFEHVDTNHKVREIKAHRGEGDDWLYDADDDELTRFVNHEKKLSCSLRTRCEELGLRYFENSNDFQQSIDDAVAYLLGQNGDG